MKTAVDSSVLLDVLGADATFGGPSREALRAAYDGGALIACDVVWAEVRAHFPDDTAFSEAMGLLGVAFEPSGAAASAAAGSRWRQYCARHPKAKQRGRVIADFLVGAHALVQADALLARDRGFYREAFRGLRVLAPA